MGCLISKSRCRYLHFGRKAFLCSILYMTGKQRGSDEPSASFFSSASDSAVPTASPTFRRIS